MEDRRQDVANYRHKQTSIIDKLPSLDPSTLAAAQGAAASATAADGSTAGNSSSHTLKARMRDSQGRIHSKFLVSQRLQHRGSVVSGPHADADSTEVSPFVSSVGNVATTRGLPMMTLVSEEDDDIPTTGESDQV